MLIDAHSHVQDIKDYKKDEEVLPVVCGYSHSSNLKAIAIAQRLGLPFVLGIAPQTVLKEDITNLKEWVSLIKQQSPNAIGEIGLDYHWAKCKEDIEKEKYVFLEMLNLSEQMSLPVVIHSRNATRDVIDILKQKSFSRGVMFHFYSGTLKEAEEAVSMGAMLSFPPLRSKERKSIINRTPLENILVETDAPFVGRHPKDVVDAVKYVAEVKNLDYDIVATQTTKNAIRFFNIKL